MNSSKQEKNWTSIIMARDYGPSGTSTCHRKCPVKAKMLRIDERLKKLGVLIVEYGMDMAGVGDSSPSNPAVFPSGFASLVEKEVLASSDYLVTVGWGSFQTSVTERFLAMKTAKNTNLFEHICMSHKD